MLGIMKAPERRTLELVMSKPPPTELDWGDIESMLRAAGVRVESLPGSRASLVKNSDAMIVHIPYRKPLAVGATAKDLAAFLRAIGVKP